MPLVSAEERIKDTEKMRHMQITRLQATQRDAINLSGLCELQRQGSRFIVIRVRLNER